MSARQDCYGCLGTGTLQGFGARPGTPCSCCTCACGAPAESDDGEPARCAECAAEVMCAPTERAIKVQP